jgi:hypothetical protein
MTIVNEGSRVVYKLETSLTGDGRIIIYDHHMFIVKATGYIVKPEILTLLGSTWVP